MEELTAWAGSRAEEFLLAIAAADIACLTGADFGAAVREVLQQFEINATIEDVIDRHFWIEVRPPMLDAVRAVDRKSTRLNSSHGYISYAVFCLKKKKNNKH